MEPEEITALIAVMIPLALVVIIVVLFLVFARRKNQLLVEQEKIKETFRKELNSSQIEIREETLKNISWELHDNIGQLMTLAKINAQLVKEDPEKIEDVKQTIAKALNELRDLSKSINPEYLKKLDLIGAIKLEIARFNRLDYIQAHLDIQGEPKALDPNKEIILFRILQEFFTNTIKHSKASDLHVSLFYTPDSVQIIARDNGIGFDPEQNASGLGIQNMIHRAKVINAEMKMHSVPEQGSTLTLNYYY